MISINDKVELTPEFLKTIGPTNEAWVHQIGRMIEIKGRACVVKFEGGDVRKIALGNLERVLTNTCLPDGQPSHTEIAVRRLEIIVEACSVDKQELAERQKARREWDEEFNDKPVPIHWARTPFDIKKS